MSWELGSYEAIAEQLLPVAEVAVNRLCPLPGEFIIDVGCGTGNAALLAARCGARVLGIDPTPRLLDVARSAGAETKADVRFESGEAASIPVADGVADGVISVFAAIFAPDPAAAAAEMVRVLAPEGRMVLTAWEPGGSLGPLYRRRSEMLDAVKKRTDSVPPPFPWHDRRALDELFGKLGLVVEREEAELVLTGASVDDYVASELRNGPLWVEAHLVLGPAGTWPELREVARAAFEVANESSDGFRLTTRYFVVTVRRALPQQTLLSGYAG